MWYFFSLLFSFTLIQISLYSFNRDTSLTTKSLVAPPESIKYFTFGFNEVVADTLWLRVLQDLDYCAAKLPAEQRYQPGQTQEVNGQCEEGWVYHMLDRVTDISPDFYIAYKIGLSALNILVGDKTGAELLLQKARHRYPKDWNLAYVGAYFYLYEKIDLAKAAEHLRIAGENGAPDWVMALSARLYDKSGQLLIGIKMLEEFLQKSTNSEHIERIQKRLEELREKYQKSQLKNQ